MKFITKLTAPEFFVNDTSNLSDWSQYKSEDKRTLKDYILQNEQHDLCIYCETKININNSHLEHLKPKKISPETLTFDYNNISVSCNGDFHNNQGDNKHYHCGHRKDQPDTMFDENLFLNPLRIKNIEDYFEFELKRNQWFIKPSDKKKDQAEYMISTLRLNDNGLPLARKKALKAFIEVMSKIPDTETRKEHIKDTLNKKNPAHISFLRYKYSKHIT